MKIAIKIIFTIAIAGLFQQCNLITSKKHDRILKYYSKDKPTTELKFELTITKIDSGYSYKYSDPLREEPSFEYIKSGEFIYDGGIKFETIKFGDYNFKKDNENEFDLYIAVGNYLDGPGPLLFNDKYGVLNASNAWGNNVLFTPEKGKSIIERMVLKNIKNK